MAWKFLSEKNNIPFKCSDNIFKLIDDRIFSYIANGFGAVSNLCQWGVYTSVGYQYFSIPDPDSHFEESILFDT